MGLFPGELLWESAPGGGDSRGHLRHREKQTLPDFPTSNLVHRDWRGHKGKMEKEIRDETAKTVNVSRARRRGGDGVAGERSKVLNLKFK